MAFAVEVAPITVRSVPFGVSVPGTIEAFEQVQITARVAGALDRVAFKEGQDVKQGEMLAVIESDRYAVAVAQAQAVVQKAQASEQAAEQQLARRQLANQGDSGLITPEEIAQYTTAVATTKADVASAQEQLHVAQLNLRDSYVRAPIAGVIQTRSVETGQYLQPGAVLGTLLRRDPLLLKFFVTEQDAPRIRPGMKATVTLRDITVREYTANITLVSGTADLTSHLIAVTGEVEDNDHKYFLRPGVFCDVTIPVDQARQGIVVPDMAIRASERGFLAYVVEGNVARERVITLGMHTSTGNIEVTNGLAVGDQLVVLGADQLSDGAPVKVAQQTTIDGFDAGAPAGTGAALPPTAPPAGSAATAGSGRRGGGGGSHP
jgi:RND family efflux transporter MFP subunit